MHRIYVPGPHRFSKSEYHQMHELGFFADQYVELIDGEIIDMPVPGPPHCSGTELAAEVMRSIFGQGCWARTQMPLDLSQTSEPVPDVAVIIGTPRTQTTTPTDALIVIEVSETTLTEDRGRKASLYAAGGIQDYWIINLVDRQLEVHRNPAPDISAPFGHSYASVTVLGPNDTPSPLARPAAQITVSELLP